MKAARKMPERTDWFLSAGVEALAVALGVVSGEVAASGELVQEPRC